MTNSDPTVEVPPPFTVGVVCALKLELAPFLEKCSVKNTDSANGLKFRYAKLGDWRIAVAECGAGRERAKQATHALIDACSPDWIISGGFSGALREEMRIGDLVVGNQVIDERGTPSLNIDLSMPADPEHGLWVGPLACAREIVHQVADKRELGERLGALAVDMESLAVAQACVERKQKFLAVRVISDDLSADLPPEILSILGPKGTIRAGAVVGSLLKRPSSLKDMWHLREKAVLASEKLATFLKSMIEQLAATHSS